MQVQNSRIPMPTVTGVEVFRVGLVVCVVLLWVSMTKVG